MTFDRLVFRVHAIKRMFKRQISADDVLHVLNTGEIIEDYPDDFRYPSQLSLGWRGSRPIHLVVAKNIKAQETIIITVYEPDLAEWESGFKRRRQ